MYYSNTYSNNLNRNIMKSKDPMSLTFLVIFILIALVALVSAIFFGATHQYLTAGLCCIFSFVLYKDIKHKEA